MVKRQILPAPKFAFLLALKQYSREALRPALISVVFNYDKLVLGKRTPLSF
jgi:hypothetical protein